MLVKPLPDGRVKAEFWLFGHRFITFFKNKEKALCFYKDLCAVYTTEAVELQDCVNRYLDIVSIKKCPQTQKLERLIFKRFYDYLQIQGIKKDSSILEVGLDHLEGFQQYLIADIHLKPPSVNRYFATIKNFFSKCKRWEYINRNPAEFVNSLPVDHIRKALWRESEFVAVYKRLNPQDQKLFYFLKLTGCRLSSACRLKVEDVDERNLVINFKTQKGAQAKPKIYQFPIHDKLKKFISPQIAGKLPSDFVFLNSADQPVNSKNFAKRIAKHLRKVNPQASSKNLSLHSLRHWFASEAHSQGFTLNEVKFLLGHSTIRVTEGYLQSDASEIRQKLNKIA